MRLPVVPLYSAFLLINGNAFLYMARRAISTGIAGISISGFKGKNPKG